MMGMTQHKNPRVLFLHPKTLYDSWPFSHDTLGEVVKVPSLVYPLLAATIRHLPVDIEIFDGYVAPESFRAYKERLCRADVIAITVMTPMKALDTELTIRLIRRINHNAIIVVGGNQASAFPEHWIERGADYVIVREGEAAFPALMGYILGEGTLDDIPNLVHRGGKSTAEAPLVSLEDAPFPAWEYMDLRPYRPRLGRHGYAATVEVSRGCVFRCDFCNINQFWNYKQRYKSVERVLAEMERLHALGVRQIFFADDNFGFDHEHTCRLFEELIRRGSPFRLGAFIRGDTVYKDAKFAALASRAGLRLALMGIETLDAKRLKAHRKGVRARDVVQMWTEVYRRCRSNNIFVLGLFLNPMHPDEAREAGRAGEGADGRVCDFHYTSDLMPQKNSLLYDRLRGLVPLKLRRGHSQRNADAKERERQIALKDMFYHDWNLPSVTVDGVAQHNWKRISGMKTRVEPYFLRGFISHRRLRRHFAWSHILLIIERIINTRYGDIDRYRTAKNPQLPLSQRQQNIVDSVLSPETIEHLVRSHRWRGPLAIRHVMARMRQMAA